MEVSKNRIKNRLKKVLTLSKSLVNRVENLIMSLEVDDGNYREIDGRLQEINYDAEKLFTYSRRAYLDLSTPEDEVENEFGFSFSSDISKRIVREKMTDSLIMKYGNGYYLKLPKLVVKENHYNNPLYNRHDNYIRDLCALMCMEYEKAIDNLPRYKEYTLVFIHNYSNKNADEDTDNISIKKVIDGINFGLIGNDTVKESHIVSLTREQNEDYTEVFIIGNHSIYDAIQGMLRFS